jgi:hypothetical protein
VRLAYLIAGSIVAAMVLLNGPRVPWIPADPAIPLWIFRGLVHGLIGFSYLVSWTLLVGGIYLVLLGILYWDMDTSEHERWQFFLYSGGTARLLWIGGVICFVLGLLYAGFTYGHDTQRWTCGLASTFFCLITCWLFWLAFPLYEQVGLDRYMHDD